MIILEKAWKRSIEVAVRVTCSWWLFLYMLKCSVLLCSCMIFLNFHEKKNYYSNKVTVKLAKRPNSSQKLVMVRAKNTPLSLPLKGTSLLTRHPTISQKPAPDEVSTDSTQSA